MFVDCKICTLAGCHFIYNDLAQDASVNAKASGSQVGTAWGLACMSM